MKTGVDRPPTSQNPAKACPATTNNPGSQPCIWLRRSAYFLQTPQVSPCLAQRLQYLQFLQALHGFSPLQVAKLLFEVLTVELKLALHNNVPAIRNSRIRCLFMIIQFLVAKLTKPT
ncbi:hypothetical protein ABID99_003569 [Mucilaginibacter sp. OAE612]